MIVFLYGWPEGVILVTKINIEAAVRRLVEEDEQKKAKAVQMKLSSNRGAKEVGKPSDPSTKLTKITQIDGPSTKKPTENSGGMRIPANTRTASSIVDEVPTPKWSTASGEKSPPTPSVKVAPKPNQSTHLREVPKGTIIKNTADGGGNKQFFSDQPSAPDIVAKFPKGQSEKSQTNTPTVGKPSVKKMDGSTTSPTAKQITPQMSRDTKKVDQINKPSGFQSDAEGAMSRSQPVQKLKSSSHNLVESGVELHLNGVKKAAFGVVNRRMLNRMVESYAKHGIKLEIVRTGKAAWQNDKELKSALWEAVDAEFNFVPESAKAARKIALERFVAISQNDYNKLYESRQEFSNTLYAAFEKIMEVAKTKYLAALEPMICNARIVEDKHRIDMEIMTESHDHQMALRQIRNTLQETYGLDVVIEHIFVDGTKYTSAQIEDWTGSV